jgi:hypothetical protein
MLVTMPRVAEMFKTVIDGFTHGTDMKLINLLHDEYINHTHDNLNTSNDEVENQWNIYLVLYDTLISRPTPSSIGQLAYCVCNCEIFDEFHQYKTKNIVGWQIAMIVNIGFQLQATATPRFHSLYDWCYPLMWLY